MHTSIKPPFLLELLDKSIFLRKSVDFGRSWEMKLRKEGSFLKKIGKCQVLFKNHFLVAQDLWGRKQPGKVSRAS